MVMENTSTTMEISTQDSGERTKNKEKAPSKCRQEMFIRVAGCMGKRKVEGHICLLTAMSMKVINRSII